MKKIFYPGSFNPFTKGHADILHRLLALADTVTVGVGVNSSKATDTDLLSRNADAIQTYIDTEGLGSRVSVTTYSGLSAIKAREIGADCMARGVRSGDFEYEYSLAAANRDAFGMETILLAADPALSFISSSIIRDLQNNGMQPIADKYLAK